MPVSSALGSSALLPAGLGFRNVLINGGFDVWQRGTSIAGVNNATSYAADRWSIFRSLAANYTLSRQAMVPSELSGFNYCARFQRTAGDTSVANLYLGRTFESITVTPLAGKTVTLSFYARKGANFSGSILDTQIEFGGGTDLPFLSQPTSPSVTNISTTLTTSWQYVTRTVVVPTTATAARILINYVPSGTAGAADYFEITGVQLEQNYQPTPFEQRPYGVELQMCQRYYWRQNSEVTGVSQRIGGTGSIYGGNTFVGVFNMPVTMRTRPTGSLEYSGLMCTDDISFDSTGGTWSISTNYGSPRSVLIYGGPLTGTVSMQYVKLGIQSGANNYMAVSAEL